MKPLFKRQETLWMRLWSELKAKIEAEEAPDCFVKQFIETQYPKMDITELQAAFLAGCKSWFLYQLHMTANESSIDRSRSRVDLIGN
jgi:hypothetical protein